MRTVSTHTYHWNLPFNDNNFELQVRCPPEVAEWLDKRIGQQKVERQEQRLRELEAALSELACWAKDIAGDCDDPIKSQQENEMMVRINKILEKDNE